MRKLKKKFNTFYKIVKETCPNPLWGKDVYCYYTEIVDHELSPAILLINNYNPKLNKKILLLDDLEPYKWFCSYIQYLGDQSETTLRRVTWYFDFKSDDEKIQSLKVDYERALDYYILAEKLKR
jgi:hypothetical protein